MKLKQDLTIYIYNRQATVGRRSNISTFQHAKFLFYMITGMERTTPVKESASCIPLIAV